MENRRRTPSLTRFRLPISDFEDYSQPEAVNFELGLHAELNVDHRRWRRGKSLGRGSYGHVWLQECNEREPHQITRAVKQIALNKLSRDGIDHREEISAMARFSRLKHRNLTIFGEFYGWSENKDTVFLAMEYFPLKDLEQYTISRTLNEDEIKKIAYDLLVGLSIMHAEGIVHRDLKPENIFVSRMPPEQPWSVKISDFGLSKRISLERRWELSSRGTFYYSAPEIERLVDLCQETPGASDIWSLGITLYRLATRQYPFGPQDLAPFCRGKLDFPVQPLRLGTYSDNYIEFIKALLRPSPQDRLSAENALQHPWFAPAENETEVLCTLSSTPTSFEYPEASSEKGKRYDRLEAQQPFADLWHTGCMASTLSAPFFASSTTSSRLITSLPRPSSALPYIHARLPSESPTLSNLTNAASSMRPATVTPGVRRPFELGERHALASHTIAAETERTLTERASQGETQPASDGFNALDPPPPPFEFFFQTSEQAEPKSHTDQCSKASSPLPQTSRGEPLMYSGSLVTQTSMETPYLHDSPQLNNTAHTTPAASMSQERRLHDHDDTGNPSTTPCSEVSVGKQRKGPIRRASAPEPLWELEEVENFRPPGETHGVLFDLPYRMLASEFPPGYSFARDKPNLPLEGPPTSPSGDPSLALQNTPAKLMTRSTSDSLLLYSHAVIRANRAWSRSCAAKLLAEQKFRNPIDGFSWAIEAGHEEVVELLLDQGVDVDTTFRDDLKLKRGTALHFAILNGRTSIARALLRRGASVSARAVAKIDPFGYMKHVTALHLAAHCGADDIARTLLDDAAADIGANATGPRGDRRRRTPLHLAVLSASYDDTRHMVRLLLSRGADPNVKDSLGLGMRPGDYAVMRGRKNFTAELPSSEVKARLAKLHLKLGPLAPAALPLLLGAAGAGVVLMR